MNFCVEMYLLLQLFSLILIVKRNYNKKDKNIISNKLC